MRLVWVVLIATGLALALSVEHSEFVFAGPPLAGCCGK